MILRSILDRTLFVLGRAVVVAAPAGALIWIMANVRLGGDTILNACTAWLDPFAGLLGLAPDDSRVPDSFSLAQERGLAFTFGACQLRDVHPNSVIIRLEGEQGGSLEVGASSPGGGRIKVFRVDGLDTSFSGELPTLVVHNSDKPGCVSQVTGALAAQGLNVATLQLNRGGRGGSAVMVIECDQPVSGATAQWLRSLPGILRVNRYTPDEEEPA